MLGKNDYDFFPKEQADFFTAKDREVLVGHKVVEIEKEEIDTKNGKRVLHTKKVPLYDEAGNPIYLVGISEDITEATHQSEKLEEKMKELEEINKLMVNRELKMVELKNEIQRLKGE
jgi:PAS domain S-box-containing protein